jgi:hypothetical protein
VTVTTPFQATYNGTVFGVGGDAQLVGIDAALRALPGIRSGDQPKGRRDGAYAGLNFLDERIFTVTLQAFNPFVGFETVLQEISNAFQNITDGGALLPFELLLPGWANSRFISCRPTKGGIPINDDYQYFKAEIPIELTAPDPLLYSTVLKTQSAGLPSPTAGLTFPVTFNATFGASTGGSVSVANAGNYITAPVITITGPVTNPSVTFTSTGAFMKFNIALGVSDVLVIDFAARSVVLNGTAYRFNTVVTGSSWWGIPPGTWSIGVSSSDAAPVAAVFSISWRDTWGFA